jgi:olfactory receptor
VGICLASATVPKSLMKIQTESITITYKVCITEIDFSYFWGVRIFLLPVMAYEHFMAVWHPLHCTVFKIPWLCVLLVLVSWMMHVQHPIFHSLVVLGMTFCKELATPNFFCEANQVFPMPVLTPFLMMR